MAVPVFPSEAEARREDGFVHSRDRTRLWWQRFVPPSPRATVAVLHGGGDHSGRYAGVTRALVRARFTVALLDFRGHGRSTGRRWHVSSFQEYQDDLDAFMARVREADGGAAPFVVAHSQGALVAIEWALAARRDVSGFVLSSPYLRLALKPPALKLLAAQVVGRVVPWLPISTGLRVVDLTSDVEMQRWTDSDPLYGRATTPSWFNASLRAQREALAKAPAFDYPLLVLAAGGDRIADLEAARTFVEAAGSPDKSLRVYDRMQHEIFNERDRERSIGDAVAWLSERAPREGAKCIDAPRG
jgi:alpha-beta hydrolase superfamily lysophospholipase